MKILYCRSKRVARNLQRGGAVTEGLEAKPSITGGWGSREGGSYRRHRNVVAEHTALKNLIFFFWAKITILGLL